MTETRTGRVRSAMGKVNRNQKAKLRWKRNKQAKQKLREKEEQEVKDKQAEGHSNHKRKRSGTESSHLKALTF